MKENLFQGLQKVTKDELNETVQTLDNIKHIDEEGNDYWSARELSKALDYGKYLNFKGVIEKSKEQMINNNINPDDHMSEVGHMVQLGSGAHRQVEDYKLDRRACYGIAMEADPSKVPVAVAKEYFLQQTRRGEVAEKVFDHLEAVRFSNNRNSLRTSNGLTNGACVAAGVKPEELGIVNDAGDRGMFDMSTKELKEKHNIPESRPTADFYGADVCVLRETANMFTRKRIEKEQARGVEQVSDVNFDCNREVRELTQKILGENPEDLITGEDIRAIEKKIKSFDKKTQKAIQQEF